MNFTQNKFWKEKIEKEEKIYQYYLKLIFIIKDPDSNL